MGRSKLNHKVLAIKDFDLEGKEVTGFYRNKTWGFTVMAVGDTDREGYIVEAQAGCRSYPVGKYAKTWVKFSDFDIWEKLEGFGTIHIISNA